MFKRRKSEAMSFEAAAELHRKQFGPRVVVSKTRSHDVRLSWGVIAPTLSDLKDFISKVEREGESEGGLRIQSDAFDGGGSIHAYIKIPEEES